MFGLVGPESIPVLGFKSKLVLTIYVPIFQLVVIMNIHKIIKSLILQSISPFGMYLFKNTPIPFTSEEATIWLKIGSRDLNNFHDSSKFLIQHKTKIQ